ncbi:uncharacterized protein LOC110821854 [Carica papaya]|uniref:uncharacterized protein LOC110821854 n=1 Tax=Carica papaya TaxID=3649 RepID=UPI000B8CC51F|nr:uncharacterized protein LOC110821854 [Carica papaya]
MAGLPRPKRVTDPLRDKVRAQLFGGHHLSYGSSGSEHSAEDDSPCLSELVHGFLEDDPRAEPSGYDSGSDKIDSTVDFTELIQEVERFVATSNVDPYRNLLWKHISKATEMFACFRSQPPIFRRNLMLFLREMGHNAAICKTKWDSSGGLTAGNYEFVDVVYSRGAACQVRYFVEVDFASEFEIARPTDEYPRLLQALPRVFVATSEELKRIVRIMSDAARRSLKSRGLSQPPWRKNRYMQNKWLGPYRRTSSATPASSFTPSIPAVNAVKCRSVGFDDAVNGHHFVRTR